MSSRIFAFALRLSVCSLCCVPVAAGPAPGLPQGPFVIENVRVFDGERALADRDVKVVAGRIAAIGSELEVAEGTRIIDGAGLTLLPGLIDCHTHVVAPEMLGQALVLGVTTELDMFMDWKVARAIKSEQADGQRGELADLRSSGTLVTSPGGHGTEYGMTIPTITDPEQASEFVDARIREGADYIKIVYGTGKAYGVVYPSISKQTMAAVVEAAHARDRLAVVHISSLQAARDAIEVGADGLAHLFFENVEDPEFGRFVARHDAFVIPTLTVLESASGVASGAGLVEDENLGPYLSATSRVNLKSSFPARAGAKESFAAANAAIGLLRAAGVPILAGSDAPNAGTAHGASIHRELELLVDAGLTPVEALRAATSAPAARFGLTDRGSIRVGLRADLLLVSGDPTTDITKTRNIVGVWKRGARVDRDAYLESVTRASEVGKPAPDGSERGLVSDFDDGDLDVQFGAGWITSTDALRGGKSTVEMTVVDGGAEGSKGSLSISGVIVKGATQAWAGVMFSPGSAPMSPANLSSKKAISFWAKGDGKSCTIMLFLQSEGFTPVVKTFVAGPEWQRHTFALADFKGTDGHDLMAVYFGGLAPGEFSYRIDSVRFD